jgi:steroid delta-isomerase-like uncharacterized protein
LNPLRSRSGLISFWTGSLAKILEFCLIVSSESKRGIMKKFLCVAPLVILFCFTIACQDKAAIAELEKYKAQAKVEEQNKDVVRIFFAAIDNGKLDRVKELTAIDFALYAPGLAKPWGADELIQGIKIFYSVFPDNTHMIEDIISEGDKIAVRIITSGSQKKDYGGIPATGKKITNSAIHMMIISDGKIKTFWKLEDTLGLMTQLGMELKPIAAKKK